MLKFLNILPYGYERVSNRDNNDAKWNSLDNNVPNALNPAYAVMNGRIYKKATYEDNTTPEEKYRQKTIAAFSDTNASNNAVNVNYSQLVDLQKQSALKNFVENRSKIDKSTPEEQKDRVLLGDQFRKIINYTKELQGRNIELVDPTLNNDIREYYNILSRLKAPTNNPLVGLNKNRDYTNMNIYDNIESMASNSTGVFSTKDIVDMSSVDKIPIRADKLEEFAKGIKKTMSDQNKLFLIELKDIIRNNTGKVVIVKPDPKEEISDISQIIQQNYDDDELNKDIEDFLKSLDARRTQRLKELDRDLRELEDMLNNRDPGMDYTRIEEVYKEKNEEYTKIYNEGVNLPEVPTRSPELSKYSGIVDDNLLDALDATYQELESEDLTLAKYEALYEYYNSARDEFVTLTGDEEYYPDIRDGHERMLRILGNKPEPQPDEPRVIDSEEEDDEESYSSDYYNDLLATYETNSGSTALQKLRNAYIVPSNQEDSKLAQTFTTKDLYSLIVRNPGMPIKTVDNYRKKATKRTDNTNRTTKFYDVINSDTPPDSGIRLIKALEENKLFYDRTGNFYKDNRNDDAKKRVLFEYLVELGNKLN
jgi:hypothetical protein